MQEDDSELIGDDWLDGDTSPQMVWYGRAAASVMFGGSPSF